MTNTEDSPSEEIRIAELRRCVDRTADALRRTASFEEARRLIEEARMHILEWFPDKSHVFDLVLRPRFTRIIDERVGALASNGMDEQ